MAGFKFKVWKEREEAKAIRERYGENSNLMLRGKPVKKPDTKAEHSFSHLLNKTFKVPEGPKPYVELKPQKPQRSFRITDAQKIQMAMRNAEKLKTRLDE